MEPYPSSPPGTTSGSTPSPRRSPTGTSPTRCSQTGSSRSSGPGSSSPPAAAARSSRSGSARCTNASPSAVGPTPRRAPCSPSVHRAPSPTGSRCPRSSCRASPTPSSRSARPTPWPGPSAATAHRSPSTGSPHGHDGGDRETDRVQRRIGDWFDRYLKDDKGADTGPGFRVTRTGGIDSTDGAALTRGASSDTYPGLSSGTESVALGGSTKTFRNPAGANPPAISAVPGVGGGLAQLSSLGVGLSIDFPGQYARFDSAPLDEPLSVTGSCGRPGRRQGRARRRGAVRQGVRRVAGRQAAGAARPARRPLPDHPGPAGQAGPADPPRHRPPVRRRTPAPARPLRHRSRLRLTGRADDVHRHPHGPADRPHRTRAEDRMRPPCPGGSGGSRPPPW